MIEISEKVIQDSIKAGLKLLSEDENLFDRVFKRLNVAESARLKKYIKDNKVNVTQGYPVSRAKLPAYAIMLGGENENNEYLGDLAEELAPEISDQLGLEREENVIEERVRVRKRGELVEFETSKKNVQAITYIEDETGEAVELSGLDIEDSKRGLVSLYGTHLVNAQFINVSYVYDARGYSSFGAMFNKSYRIEVWAANGDLVVHLYHLLKWILLLSKTQFHERGWNEIKIGGADFEPVPEHDNEMTFRRAVSLSFNVEETYELDESYIQDIIVKFNREES